MIWFILLTIFLRALLVVLFLPFSALDKLLNFNSAVAQAGEVITRKALAKLAILAGLGVEVTMSLCILSGVADRLGAVVLAGYCIVTAVLWKRFWQPGDFWRSGTSKGRELFWEFLKNLSLAGGFLLLASGGTAVNLAQLSSWPDLSTHPYGTP